MNGKLRMGIRLRQPETPVPASSGFYKENPTGINPNAIPLYTDNPPFSSRHMFARSADERRQKIFRRGGYRTEAPAVATPIPSGMAPSSVSVGPGGTTTTYAPGTAEAKPRAASLEAATMAGTALEIGGEKAEQLRQYVLREQAGGAVAGATPQQVAAAEVTARQQRNQAYGGAAGEVGKLFKAGGFVEEAKKLLPNAMPDSVEPWTDRTGKPGVKYIGTPIVGPDVYIAGGGVKYLTNAEVTGRLIEARQKKAMGITAQDVLRQQGPKIPTIEKAKKFFTVGDQVFNAETGLPEPVSPIFLENREKIARAGTKPVRDIFEINGERWELTTAPDGSHTQKKLDLPTEAKTTTHEIRTKVNVKDAMGVEQSVDQVTLVQTDRAGNEIKRLVVGADQPLPITEDMVYQLPDGKVSVTTKTRTGEIQKWLFNPGEVPLKYQNQIRQNIGEMPLQSRTDPNTGVTTGGVIFYDATKMTPLSQMTYTMTSPKGAKPGTPTSEGKVGLPATPAQPGTVKVETTPLGGTPQTPTPGTVGLSGNAVAPNPLLLPLAQREVGRVYVLPSGRRIVWRGTAWEMLE